MHELRRDILLGRWVAVLSESKAPSEYEQLSVTTFIGISR